METQESLLFEQERFILNALRNDSSARAQRRARIILAWADGQDNKTIARELHSRPGRVRRVIAAFQAQRLDIFSAASRKRVPPLPRTTFERAKSSAMAQLSMHAAAQQVLSHQYSKLKNTEQAVRAGDDVEAVHDMRVAARRMNSAFRLFKKYLPKKRVRKLLPPLEQLRDVLGAARNLDVLSANLQRYRNETGTPQDAELETLSEYWRSDRLGQQNWLVQLLDSPDYADWCARMEAFCEDKASDSSPRVAEVLPAMLWQQYGAVRAYELQIEHASLQELHALRIALKHLRYSLEFFREAFEASPAETDKTAALIKPIIVLQDQLGLMQDAVVAGRSLTDFLGAQAEDAKIQGRALPEFQALAAYYAHVHSQIAELRARLPEPWAVVTDAAYRAVFASATAAL